MTRKFLAVIALAVILAVAGTAVVAYRLGLRHGQVAPVEEPASSTHGCVDFRDAAAHAGENGCVTGRVLRVFTSRAGNTFLDFCSDYRNCPFTSVIFSSDKNKFGNLQLLAGQKIEIHGSITVYQEKPEIIIREPDQIRPVR